MQLHMLQHRQSTSSTCYQTVSNQDNISLQTNKLHATEQQTTRPVQQTMTAKNAHQTNFLTIAGDEVSWQKPNDCRKLTLLCDDDIKTNIIKTAIK